MNLHILFSPAQTASADGSASPTASLALTLDEEVQYRCAGFVQAEIERYAEELEVQSPQDDGDSDEDGSDDQGDDRGSAQPKKGNNRRKEKASKGEPSGKQSSLAQHIPLCLRLMPRSASLPRETRTGIHFLGSHGHIFASHQGRRHSFPARVHSTRTLWQAWPVVRSVRQGYH